MNIQSGNKLSPYESEIITGITKHLPQMNWAFAADNDLMNMISASSKLSFKQK
jgi:hypothetical protein